MTRRPYKEGSIYKNKKGDGWVASISYTDRLTGKRVRPRRVARTKTEAREKLAEMRKNYLDSGRLADNKRTIDHALDDYKAYRLSNPDLADGTHERDDWMIQVIRDGLGRMRTVELTLADCEKFLRSASRGLTKPSGEKRRQIGMIHLRRIRSALINVLDNELRLGLINQNVAKLSLAPAKSSKAKKTRSAMNLDEFEQMLVAARGATELLIEFVGRYGLRPAEARAIRWSAVDLDAQTLQMVEEMDKKNVHSPMKNGKARRSIRIEEDTVKRLETWKSRQSELRGLLRTSWIDLDVVASTDFGGPHSRHQFNYRCKKLCRQLEIQPISPYDLRHTAMSYQAERGHSAWEIADWAGTSEKMVSDVYRHQLNKVSKLRPIT